MENKKHKKKVVKPKNRFTICCFCLNSSSSDIELKDSLEGNEAYDYVVEKLAIKKVPISLFATDEDLEEMQNINSSASMEDFRYTPRDKKSAMVFSSCYSKIPKNVKNTENENKFITVNKDLLSCHKTQENQSIIESNNTESSKDICIPVTNNEKEIVTAEVYNEPSATRKFVKITPELQETLNELGSKQRPTGSPGIKQKRVPFRANTETTNIISPVTVERYPCDKTRPHLPPVGEEVSQTESNRQNILKQMFSPPNTNVENKINEESDLSMEQRRSNEINALLSSLANNAAASQKWKIIIKEHGNDEGVDDATTHKSTDSGSEYVSESETVFETE